MQNRVHTSRREFLTGVTGSALATSVLAGATVADKEKLPEVPKRLEKAFMSPAGHPNGLQCVPDGLWIHDQASANDVVHKVRYEDGSVMVELVTESNRGSGITYGDGAVWLASTQGLITLKVDPRTGKTLATFPTPGAGPPSWGPPRGARGAHGIEWVDDKYWIAVPPAVTIYLVEPNTGKPIRSIPAPGTRPHGIAWDKGYLWCVESNDMAIYKMDPENGKLLAKIQLSKGDPVPHGMSMRDGVFWCCDSHTGLVYRLV